MAMKKISQQTFDDVVKENIEDFEMTVEDAIEDAVKQFESQGVDLSNIVREPRLFQTGQGNEGTMSAIHPVVKALQLLREDLQADVIDQEAVSTQLKTIRAECDVDLARRCMAGSNDAYPILMKAVSKFREDPTMLKPVLLTLCSLVNGQPDLLDEAGCEELIALMSMYEENEPILERVVRIVRLFCVKHETNRQMFVGKLLINKLTALLSTHRKCPGIVKETCICLRVLTFDDDVRVPFGKGHEHAKMIVTEGDALKMILGICQEYTNNQDVLVELFATLGKLTVRNEFCQEVMELGGVKFIIDAFRNSLEDKVVARQALVVMRVLAGNDGVKVEIVKLGGLEVIVEAMAQHQTNASIAEAACFILATVALRNPTNSSQIMAQQGHAAIVQIMKIHPDHEGVQKQACRALRNLVCRTQEHCTLILELGAESLINRALDQFPDCRDEVKAALRDLNCKVDLKERWKGKNGTIPK